MSILIWFTGLGVSPSWTTRSCRVSVLYCTILYLHYPYSILHYINSLYAVNQLYAVLFSYCVLFSTLPSCLRSHCALHTYCIPQHLVLGSVIFYVAFCFLCTVACWFIPYLSLQLSNFLPLIWGRIAATGEERTPVFLLPRHFLQLLWGIPRRSRANRDT